MTIVDGTPHLGTESSRGYGGGLVVTGELCRREDLREKLCAAVGDVPSALAGETDGDPCLLGKP